MLERLQEDDWIRLGQIICQISDKRNKSFMKYYIIKIIDNSNNVEKSLKRISNSVRKYKDDERQMIYDLKEIYELEDNQRINALCSFYND